MPRRLRPTIQLLRRLAALDGADELSLARLAVLMSPRRVGPGQILVGAGTEAGSSYVIVEGWAEVRISGETVGMMGPGRFVGGAVRARHRALGAEVTSCASMTLLAVGPAEMAALAADPVGCRLVETGLDDRLRRLETLAAWHATA